MTSQKAGSPVVDSLAEIKRRKSLHAFERHKGEVPDGFRFYFRRYGKYGGRWRAVDPHGCWVESPNKDVVEAELWWMVVAYEADQVGQT